MTKEKTPTAEHQHIPPSILLHQADSHPSQMSKHSGPHGNLGKRPRIRRLARAELELRQLRPGARKTNGPHGETRSTRTETGQATKAGVGVSRCGLLEIWIVENMAEWDPTLDRHLDTDGKETAQEEDGDRE